MPPAPYRAQKKGATDAVPQDLEAASLEELNQKILSLEREKNKEEEHRNYMQLERVGAHTPPCLLLSPSVATCSTSGVQRGAAAGPALLRSPSQ